MTDYVTKRLNYYNGQFLLSGDFVAEQDYHANRQRLHGRMMHFWGIAEGLDVTESTTESQTVDIAPGSALDNLGNQILLATTGHKLFRGAGAGTRYLVIRFAEVPSDPPATQYIFGDTRMTQAPEFVLRSSLDLVAGDVVLATLVLELDGSNTPLSESLTSLVPSDRTYAGLRVTGPDGDGYDLRPRSDGSLVLERCLSGDSSLTPLVHVASTGGVGIGAAPTAGMLLAVGPNNELTVSSLGAIDAPSLAASGNIGGATLSASGNVSSASLSVGGAQPPSGSNVVAVGTSGQLQINASGGLSTSGTVSTTSSLTAGSAGQFAVNSTGAITAATGIASSGTIHFSGLTGSKAVFTDGSSNLTSGTLGVAQGGTGAITLTGVLKGNVTSAITAMTGTAGRGTRWTDANTIAAGSLFDDGSKVGVGAAPPSGTMFAVGSSSEFKVDSAGNLTVPQISCPMWSVTTVASGYSNSGANPAHTSINDWTITTHGGTLLVFVAGTASLAGTSGRFGVTVTIDSLSGYTQDTYTAVFPTNHVTLTTVPMVFTGLGAGSHTLHLAVTSNTKTDSNDHFSITVVEFPF
jgi:hypothetical protein